MKKIYLAIPYSGMEESSYSQANTASVMILNKGHNVFSPITHSHPLAALGVAGTWEFWKDIDFQFIDWADELWVLMPEEGIAKVINSTGVQAEIAYAKKTKTPVRFIVKGKENIVFLEKEIEEIL